jgi:hypothetical protein
MYGKADEIDEISNFHNMVHFAQGFDGDAPQGFDGDALFLVCFFIGLIHHNNIIWKAQASSKTYNIVRWRWI